MKNIKKSRANNKFTTFLNLRRFLGNLGMFRISEYVYRVAQKSKPLPNYHKIVLNRIKVC